MNLFNFIKVFIKKVTKNQNDVAGVIFLFIVPLIMFCAAVRAVTNGYISTDGELWTMFDAITIFLIFFFTSFMGFVSGLFISEKKDNE